MLFHNSLMNLVSDGYIPRLESKEWECWKLLDWRLNSENDSRLHGQPSMKLTTYRCSKWKQTSGAIKIIDR